MALNIRFRPGTVGHALGHACNAVGVKRVADALGKSPATVYDWFNPDRPQQPPSMTLEQAQMLAGMVAAKGLPHYFGLLFGAAGGAAVPKPASGDLLHHLAFLGELRGRTSALVGRLFDRAGEGRRGGPFTVPAADQTALIAAVEAEIAGLTAFKALLMETTSVATLALGPAVLPPDLAEAALGPAPEAVA